MGGDEICEEVFAYMMDSSKPMPSLEPDMSGEIREIIVSLFADMDDWTEEDERLWGLISHPDHWKVSDGWVPFEKYFFYYFNSQVRTVERRGVSVMPFLLDAYKRSNLKEEDLLVTIMNDVHPDSWYIGADGEATRKNCAPSSVGKYIAAKAVKDVNHVYQLTENKRTSFRANLFEFLVKHEPNFTEKHFEPFLAMEHADYCYNVQIILPQVIEALLLRDAQKYESLILEKIKEIQSVEAMTSIYGLLRQYLPEKHGKDILKHNYALIELSIIEQNLHDGRPYNFPFKFDRETRKVVYYLLDNAVETVIALDPDGAKEAVGNLYVNLNDAQMRLLTVTRLVAQYGNDALPYLFKGGLEHLDSSWTDNYIERFFNCLNTLDFAPYEAQLWDMTSDKNKKIRNRAALTLAKLGDKVLGNAEKLMANKKSDIRQIGATILSAVKTPKSIAILTERLNKEEDDNTRDIMLETVKDILPMPQNEAEMKAIIAAADARKKLTSSFHYHMEEDKLPRLYWRSGEELTDKETRFLFYRQTRSKEIRLDPETKMMLPLLDKQKCRPFAHELLKVFTEAGADTKIKYCLPLATSLGGDTEINLLKSKILYWVDNARGKMAEYAVKAIALNGSSKSLRLIEFYARKYKSKYKNIGAAANESFDLVAEELGIPAHDLADTIIPDFGFEGLVKEFEVDGQIYRAFVNDEFKLAFMDANNTVLKALPKGASEALKEEFKDTAKEIKELVTLQTGRLEHYTVIQRQWSSENWTLLFTQNPVLAVFATRIIWGAYASDGALLFTFRYLADQSLVNMKNEKVTLDETHNIGLVHPISLDAGSITYWTKHLANSKSVPAFPQLSRKVTLLPENERDQTMNSSFLGLEFPGLPYLSRMEKTGWSKMVGDAALITSYYKSFPEFGVIAFAAQTGMHGIGLYEDNAIMGRFYFVREIVMEPGGYYYSDPSNPTDVRLVRFGDVSPIVYSEVVADLSYFKENQPEA